jgi:hypothetical protein
MLLLLRALGIGNSAIRGDARRRRPGLVRRYANADIKTPLHRSAVDCATRGSRSGRVAWQFIQDLAGRLGVAVKD